MFSTADAGSETRTKIETSCNVRKVPLGHVLIALVALGLLLIATVVFLWLESPWGLQLGGGDAIQSIVQILSLLIAALMVLVTIIHHEWQARETAEQEIYQRLELESIALFRFDIENPELAAHIWANRPLPAGDADLDAIRVQQYVSQILNLFEMAVRFRKSRIMPPDVFGSWVIWMNSLCASKTFCAYWRDLDPELRWNYVPELRHLLDRGLTVHHGDGTHAPIHQEGDASIHARNAFFEAVSSQFDECKQVREWLVTKEAA